MQQTEQSHKEVILTQNPALKERKLRLRWLLAISSLPLFGIITAFGIAPQTSTQDIAISTIVEQIELPELNAPLVSDNLASQNYWQADQVRRDDTLASLMDRLNVQNSEALEFLRRNPEASALASQLRPGRSIQAQVNENGELLKLQYQLSATSTLTIDRTDSGYQAKTGEPVLEVHNVLKTAEIRSSLFAATDAADIPDAIAIQMAEIFSSDIDFHTDLRKGDRFVVIYEAKYDNGSLVNTGQVLAAEFTNQGKTYKAVMYRNPEGKVAYYTPEGKSLHKSFLRSPLEFTRISSGFTMGRFHPILQKMRAHKGVDLAAPIGTRIKAPADGVVNFVGVKSGYGNVIYLQHANGVSTVYGHLSRFTPGLRNGMKVSQGDIIGFVGMTGMATGPHLHYEFLLNGVHRDPLKVALPAAVPIAPQYKADFLAHSESLSAQLRLLSASAVASLD
ncbi:peptidoglycan DD-metalloendopeptidase family protein [Methylobacillus caricis]|uniref:peptidoglycan DD-metalloendopeptidase family protein n=1 Tax=Methylobacillus caricis TaxID=1971611 RepID=UPI001CFF9BC4|nr:peptidoglycan DD-metalloendopeptidase family protein [Methylobacillus caricis]MCB5189112.1 peptidoglycan DD-metalloendopeptidase family protein [Methylobacillus caricis]